jgi:hypothetical protein
MQLPSCVWVLHCCVASGFTRRLFPGVRSPGALLASSRSSLMASLLRRATVARRDTFLAATIRLLRVVFVNKILHRATTARRVVPLRAATKSRCFSRCLASRIRLSFFWRRTAPDVCPDAFSSVLRPAFLRRLPVGLLRRPPQVSFPLRLALLSLQDVPPSSQGRPSSLLR